MLPWLITGFEVAIRGAGVWCAGDAIMTARSPQGSIAWVIALLLVPEVAVPMYLIFGSRRFVGYVRMRRKGRFAINKSAASTLEGLRPAFDPGSPSQEDPLASLGRLVGIPATAGNAVDILINGEATFKAIFEAIAGAKWYLLVEFYILRNDEVGKRFQQALKDAARRGVAVRLIYDGLGSFAYPRRAIRELELAGVKVTAFRSYRTVRGLWRLVMPWRHYQLNFRNHRKIVVADGDVALMGGLNIGDEYLGKHKTLTPWRDTHVRLRGPSVQAVQFAWLENWYCATSTTVDLNWAVKPAATTARGAPACVPAGPEAVGEGGTMPPEGPPAPPTNYGESARVLIVPSGPADDLETCALMFETLINHAEQRLWIATPYFVPDMATIHALQMAALRNVDVRILIPEGFDSRSVWLSAFTYYDDVLDAGIRLFRYQPGFMHQKVLLSDDIFAVGTANLDIRSFRINFEITALIQNAEINGAAEAMLAEDFNRATEVKRGAFGKMAWGFRLLAKTARLFAPIQ
ncbi:cardiolipin synthase [soil metagenome]